MSEEGQVPEGQEPQEPVAPVTGNTNDAINASLEDVTDPDVLKKMVKSLRGEAAKHRTEKQANAAKLVEYDEWKTSQLSELDKANQRAELAEAKAVEALRRSVIKEFNIDDDYHEFITGSTEDELTAKAQKFAKLSKGAEDNSVLPAGTANLRPGKRGNPVGAQSGKAEDVAFFEGLWNDRFGNSA